MTTRSRRRAGEATDQDSITMSRSLFEELGEAVPAPDPRAVLGNGGGRREGDEWRQQRRSRLEWLLDAREHHRPGEAAVVRDLLAREQR
jgi:hypothetical protein